MPLAIIAIIAIIAYLFCCCIPARILNDKQMTVMFSALLDGVAKNPRGKMAKTGWRNKMYSLEEAGRVCV